MKRPHRILRVTGGRVAWTNTSRIPDDRAAAAIRFVAREVDLSGVVVHLKRCGDYRRTYGRAYHGIPFQANRDGLRPGAGWRYLIVVTDGRGPDGGWVATLAHEAKHVEQFRERLPISEVRARAFADGVARRWKEATGR